MKIEFRWDRRKLVVSAVLLLLMAGVCAASGVTVWLAVPAGALCFVIKALHITLPEQVKWFNGLWAAAFLIVSAVLTERMVQYLLLEPENRGRLSTANERLNVLCCFIWIAILFAITASVKLSCIIGHISLLVLAGINYFVYQFRGNEFSFGDLKAVSTGLSVAGKYQFRLDERAGYVILAAILYVTLLLKLRIQLEKKWMLRLAALAVAVVCSVYVADKTAKKDMESWEQKGTYRNGYILNFVLSIRDSFVVEPEGYTQAALQALEQKYPKQTQQGSEDDPTIIVVMNESFADLSVLGPLLPSETVTPFIDSLSENTVKGKALSSVFGAKTPNSEWEFLTGNSMAFLPGGSVPYQQYMSKQPYSLVSTLKERGYTCLAMHPYYETGWSRNKVYPSMGFDETYFIDDFDQNSIFREYITDEELYRGIIEQYEARKDSEKLFIMSITMQNHGGYTDEYANFQDTVQMVNGNYSDVDQYLSLIHESDRAIGELVNYFKQVDDKVEIVFFGDHQPSLNSRFYRQINGKGLSGLTLSELEDLFTVPFFIWTNYDSEEKEVELTSLNFLSTLALEQADIELPSYNSFLKDLMEVVPAMNARAYYAADKGKYRHYGDAATSTEESWLHQYEILQYNNLFDSEKSGVFFPYYQEE